MKRLSRFLLFVVVLSGSLVALTGTPRDPWLWAYIGAWIVAFIGLVASADDDLMRERFHPPEASADQTALRFIRFIALATMIVGALDVGRWHLAPAVPSPLRIAGLAGMIAGCALIAASMRANRFFSAVVRVQRDRGHRVVSSGPYARIRHPGYAGMIFGVPLSALALGSWLGVGLALTYAALIVRRVAFEDGFLQRNLEGYREYASMVRYRLVPGAW